MDPTEENNVSTTASQDSKEEAVQEIRTLIDNNQVGGIIGKGGANVKHVREQSGAFVSILKAEYRNVTERIMVVKGSCAQIAKATHLIANLLVDASQTRDKKDPSSTTTTQDRSEQATSIRFLVHRSAVGAVIGKAGAVIKETQANTNTRVHVSNDPLPQSTEKSVTITGTPSNIYEAALLIVSQLRDNPLRTGTKVYPYVPGQPIWAQQPYMPPPYGQPGVPAALYQQPYALPPGQASSTQKIAIPTVCAGCVIGKAGSVIRDLRAQSGTNISIADPDPASPNERVVTLTGLPSGIQTAVFLIKHLVEQYQPPPTY